MNFDLSTWRDPEWEHFRKVLQQAVDKQVPAPIRLPLKVLWVRQQKPVSDDMRFMAEAEVEGAEWEKRRYRGYANVTLQQCLSYKNRPADILFIVVDQLAASMLNAAYQGIIGLSLQDTISAYQTEYDRHYRALMQTSVSKLAIPAGVAGATDMQIAESARFVDQGMADFDKLILPQLITNAVRPPNKSPLHWNPWESHRTFEVPQPVEEKQYRREILAEFVDPPPEPDPNLRSDSFSSVRNFSDPVKLEPHELPRMPRVARSRWSPIKVVADPNMPPDTMAMLSPDKVRQVQELVNHGLIDQEAALELLGAPKLPQEVEEKCSEFEQAQMERRRKAFWKD